MTKNIINKVLTFAMTASLLMSLGCEKVFDDALSRVSDSRETLEGMLGDANKVKGMLTACYLGMPMDRSDIYFWTTEESLTDNCFDAQGQSMENWRSGLLSPSEPAIRSSRDAGNKYGQMGWWGRYWGAIRYCNNLIENIDKITVPLSELPQAERDIMLDEAIALRAFFHFKIISYYGPVPFMHKNELVTFEGWTEKTRPTYDEIATTIANELQGVIDRGNIPLKREAFNENDKYRMPMAYIYGLKSRVLLYNASPLNNPEGDVKKYEAAAAAAKALLDLNAFSLEPFENTKKMYISPMSEDLEATEVIWRSRSKLNQLSNVHGMDLTATVPQLSVHINHKAGETPSQEIVDCYELKDGSLIIENYDASHANPIFTAEALAAGYDDVNAPYVNRDERLARDILFNGNDFGESYQMGPIKIWTYLDAPSTGTNGISVAGSKKKTYTGYYYAKDRDPIWYGKGTAADAHKRCNQHTVLMRLGEIYLNYAEALCGAGKLSEACDALDKTRLRAKQPSIKEVPGFVLDKNWLMKRIQNERRVELVLEDHRFYDVRRWELISTQNNNTISGMLVEKVAENTFTHTRYQMPFVWACHNEKYKILPIPLVDKTLLPKMEQPDAWK